VDAFVIGAVADDASGRQAILDTYGHCLGTAQEPRREAVRRSVEIAWL
jgi:hypothetical protein